MQALALEFGRKNDDAGHVPAGPRQRSCQPELHRIGAEGHYGNLVGGRGGGTDGLAADRDQDIRLAGDEFAGQSRQPRRIAEGVRDVERPSAHEAQPLELRQRRLPRELQGKRRLAQHGEAENTVAAALRPRRPRSDKAGD